MGVVDDQDECRRDETRAPQGGRYRLGQDGWVSIGFIETHPDERTLILLAPLRQQGRLAISGRSGHEHEREFARILQAAEELGSPHELPVQPRDSVLSLWQLSRWPIGCRLDRQQLS